MHQWIPGVAALITSLVGLYMAYRSRHRDVELSASANIQSTFDAIANQERVVQEELTRHRKLLRECEESSRVMANQIAARDREIANLKEVVAEHVVTIAKHERTINHLKGIVDGPEP